MPRLQFCSGRNYRNAHPTTPPPSHTNSSQPSAPRSRRRKPRPYRHRHRRTFRWLYRSGQPSPHLPTGEENENFDEYTSVAKSYKPTRLFSRRHAGASFCRDSTRSLTLDLESDVAVGENLRHLVQVQPLAIFRRHGE